MFIAEVVETRTAFKPDQKDHEGNLLPLGSIEVRIGSHESNLGQVRTVFVRPAVWNSRIPLIGEVVTVIISPTNDWSTSKIKGSGFMYFSALNATDDLVLHKFPRLWKRRALAPSGNSGERKSDKEEPGYTFPESPKTTDPIQPFEGDDIINGRFGASLRFSSTIKGDLSIYSKKPTWEGSNNGDPILYLRVAKPSGGGSLKYTIEDIEKDESTIVLTSNQKLKNFKAGFDKNQDAKKLAQFDGKSQIAINSNRVVLNANKDMLLLIGKEKAILTGKKVLFQSDKYKVDLDELMDFLKKWLGEDVKVFSGTAQISTPAGPTSFSTNMAAYQTLQNADFNKFKQP